MPPIFEEMDWLSAGSSLLQSFWFYYLRYEIQSTIHPLSMESLRTMRGKLQGYEPDTKNLIAGLDVVLRNFQQEPQCVKENATVTIKTDKVVLVFSCGKSKCNISVDDEASHGDPQYNVSELSGDVYLARLCCRPQPLSTASLQEVKKGLERWEVGEDLRRCLKLALQEFPKEPASVQENARLVIRKRKVKLEFLSGEGQCEISVDFHKHIPCYHIQVKNWEMYRDRLSLCKEHLSARNLERIRRKVRFLKGTPRDVRKSLNIALEKFCQEPKEVQQNARMVIEVEGGEMELVSGNGENGIDVSCLSGKIH